MLRLASMLYAIIATTLAGTGVIAVLAVGATNWVAIVAATGIGALLAVPASWYVAKQIQANLR